MITCDVHDFATKTRAFADAAPASAEFVCSPNLNVKLFATSDKRGKLNIAAKDPSALTEEEQTALGESIHHYVLQAHIQGTAVPEMTCAVHDFYAKYKASRDESIVKL